jgi:hypothetical protein
MIKGVWIMTIKETRNGTRVNVAADFATPDEAFAAEKAYRDAYPPQAYGTMLTVMRNEHSQLWELRGNRSASCD